MIRTRLNPFSIAAIEGFGRSYESFLSLTLKEPRELGLQTSELRQFSLKGPC